MSTLKREFVPGNFYHIYNRGNSKQKIFLDEADKNRFLSLLYLCNGEKKFQYADLSAKTIFEFCYEKGNNLVDICAWVLMDNHFHLLIYIPENISSEQLSKFMSRIQAAYLKYFNQRYNRTGSLFESRFQHILVEEDKYLSHLYSYIHLNPLKLLDPDWKQNGLKIKKANLFLDDYRYSSYHDLVIKKNRCEKNILTTNLKIIELSDTHNTMDKLFSTLYPRGSR